VRDHATHFVQLIGSAKRETATSSVLGEAIGGKMIRLYQINDLTPDDPWTYRPEYLLQASSSGQNYDPGYVYVLQHEFAHILHQSKMFPDSFEPISAANYQSNGWRDIDPVRALNLGFITRYASFGVEEDFVETLAFYVTRTQAERDAYVATATAAAQAIFAQKLEIVRSYMAVTWGINLNELRDIIIRRVNELSRLEVVDLK
jgi:substrate import-associated zinc metallohydrolase lipoprotein